MIIRIYGLPEVKDMSPLMDLEQMSMTPSELQENFLVQGRSFFKYL